jgi:ribosome biogenesis GTPase A
LGKKNPWKSVWDVVDKSDVVLEVVDARFPSRCRSFYLENKIKELQNKELILVLNKSDLIPRPVGKRWIRFFKKEGFHAVLVSARERLGTSILRKQIQRFAPKKNKYEDVILGVVGLPNTGKSSLINILKGRSSAPTAPIPGFTKAMQLLRIGARMMVYDTPGVIPSAIPFSDQLLLGIIRPEQLSDPIKACGILARSLEDINPGIMQEVYGVPFKEIDSFLVKLAIKRNRVLKGGEPDIGLIARQVIMDHVKGNLRVYEQPPDEKIDIEIGRSVGTNLEEEFLGDQDASEVEML